MWAFNSEELAYAIYNCKIPVISGVGHETDVTICDFVSDLRAPTPSAAAELAVPDKAELLSYYRSQRQYVSSMISLKLRQKNNSISELNRRISAVSPGSRILEYESKLDLQKAAAKHYINNLLSSKQSQISNNASKLEGLNPLSVLSRGYSIAEMDGKIITSASMIKKDDVLTVRLSDGKIKAKVTETVTGE